MDLDLSKISLLRHIHELFVQVGNDKTLHAKVRKHRLELELGHFRFQHERKKGVLHASSMGFGHDDHETCERKVAYRLGDWRGASDINARAANVFEVGHDAHAKYQGALSWIFKEHFQAEIPAADLALGLVGTCDGRVMYPYDDRRVAVGVEIKTIKSRYFDALEQPQEKHIDQATIYLFLLNMEAVSILYESKDDQRTKEFVIGPDFERWEKIQAKAREIYGYHDLGILPPRRTSRFECMFCSFSHHCRPDSIKLKYPGLLRRRDHAGYSQEPKGDGGGSCRPDGEVGTKT